MESPFNKNEKAVGKVSNILIIILKRVGEILVTTPSIRALKKSFPKAKITVLLYVSYIDAISNNPYIDEVYPINPNDSLLDLLKTGIILRRRRYDITIDYLANPKSALLTFVAGSPIRIGLKKRIRRIAYNRTLRNFPDSSSYIADYRLNAVRLLNVAPDGLEMDFFLDSDQIASAKEFLSRYNFDSKQKFISISPISLRKWKLWSFKEFAKTADYIWDQYKLKTILVCGPGEYHFLTQVKDIMKNEPTSMIEFTDLKTLGYTLGKSCLHIGNDGGINHLSAAVRTPTITIYGSGKADKWNNNNNPKLIAISKKMECRQKKCYKSCIFNYKCLSSITFAALKAPIDYLL